MAKPMFLRKLKNRIFFAMAKVIAGKPKGNYMAFDDPSEIEGIGEIGYKLMAERFIVKKIEPYFKVAGWDMTEVYRALEGKSGVMWI